MSENADKIKIVMDMAEAITEGISPDEAAQLCEALSKICKSLAGQVKRPLARWGLRLASSVLEDQAEELGDEKGGSSSEKPPH